MVSVEDNAGTVQENDVPKSSNNGMALKFKVSDDKIEYTIHTKNIASNGADINWLALCTTSLCF